MAKTTALECDLFLNVCMQGPNREANFGPYGYSPTLVLRPEEGEPLSDMAADTVALIQYGLSTSMLDPASREVAALRIFMQSVATYVVPDDRGVVCATASYKLHPQLGGKDGWGVLWGVAAVPEIGGDPTGETQKIVAIRAIEKAARAGGMGGLMIVTSRPDEQAFYIRQDYILITQGEPFLYKYLTSAIEE